MPDGGFSTNFRLNGDFNIFNLTFLSLKHKSSIAFFFISGGAEAGAKIPEHWWCDLKKKLATLLYWNGWAINGPIFFFYEAMVRIFFGPSGPIVKLERCTLKKKILIFYVQLCFLD